MGNRLKALFGQPGQGWRRRMALLGLWVGVAAGGYWCGRYFTSPAVQAQGPTVVQPGQATVAAPASDYSRRVVAYIHGTVPVTREELGEYLIARMGADKIKHVVNKRIIEHAAKQKGIEVTGAEVEASLMEDMAGLGVDRKQFVSRVLKAYSKTLYEWKEDVIRPKLLMQKMCRARVSVTREDLALAYEAHFGEKVDCKIIMWPHGEEKQVLHNVWPKIQKDEKEFDSAARLQPSPSLAAVAGHIKPVGRHSTGEEEFEKVLFSLKPGEVSHVLKTREGLVVAKCLSRVPPDTAQTFDQRKPALEKEVYDKKVALEIGKLFRELSDQAKPQMMVTRFNSDDPIQVSLPDEKDIGAAPAAPTPPAAMPNK